MRGPVKIQVSWPKKSILAENTLENAKINAFEIQYKCLELKSLSNYMNIVQNLISFLVV